MRKVDLIFNENLLQNKLLDFNSPQRITLKDNFFTPSAVLFAIIPYKDRPYDLVLIHRSERGLNHRGEMSFPGGKYDPSIDISLQDTALRETEEEIGVPKEKIKILGCLDDFPTMTHFIITPFVGIINKDQKFNRDEREVQEILKVPIDFFVDKKHFREQAVDIEDKKFPVFYFNYTKKDSSKTYTIWGATAYMISNYIEKIYNVNMSKLGLKRLKLEKIKHLKEYIKYRDKITNKF